MPDQKTESLAEKLRRQRNKQNLSISETAGQLRVSSSTYRDWEGGRRILGEPYEDLAKLFQVSLVALMTGRIGSEMRIWRCIEDINCTLFQLSEELRSMNLDKGSTFS